MADCCSTAVGKLSCFQCGQVADKVSRKTLLHHVCSPDNLTLPACEYYFCANSQCDTVYFSGDGTQHYGQAQVRERAWQKSGKSEDLICFCFGVSHEQLMFAETPGGDNPLDAFIVEQTKQGLCECEARNISGKCCLGLIKKTRKA